MPPKLNTTHQIITTTRSRLDLTGDDIVEMLAEAFPGLFATKPKVTFRVPGGADWSYTALDVDADCPVTVAWEEGSAEGGEGLPERGGDADLTLGRFLEQFRAYLDDRSLGRTDDVKAIFRVLGVQRARDVNPEDWPLALAMLKRVAMGRRS